MHIKDIGNSEHKQDTVFPYPCSRAIRTEKKKKAQLYHRRLGIVMTTLQGTVSEEKA